MKHLLLSFLLFPSLAFSQWNIIRAHADSETSIYVVNKDTVIATTDHGGRVHRTLDGGQSWSFSQTIFMNEWFTDVQFPSDQVGYACGGTAFGSHTCFLTKTTDAGLSWTPMTSNGFQNCYSFLDLFFVNDTVGFISGEQNFLLKTTNGGISLTLQAPLPYPIYHHRAIEFPSDSVGYISVTESFNGGWTDKVFRILKTTDQGATWHETAYIDTLYNIANNSREIQDIQFLDDNVGFAVGESGTFLRTTNGGNSWDVQYLLPYSPLNTVHFVNANIGFINNAGGVYKTTDGGDTWYVQQINPVSIISGIEMYDENIGYAVGDLGIFKTTNGGDVATNLEPVQKSRFSLIPNPVETYLSVKSSATVINKISVIDMFGKLVMEVSKDFGKIDLRNLSAGVYVVLLDTSEGIVAEKIIKN